MPPTQLKQTALPFQPSEAQMAVFSTWSEDTLLGYVKNTAKLCGWLIYHTRFSLKSDAGFPDLCLVSQAPRQDGRLIFAELKREGLWPTEGRLSKSAVPHWINGQEEWLKALYDTPAEVYIWWPSDVRDIAAILSDGPGHLMPCVLRMRDYVSKGRPRK